MNSKRAYFAMLGLCALLIIGLGASVFFGEQLLHKQSAKLMALKLDNESLDQQQIALNKAKSDLAQYADLGNLAKAIVPQDKDQAKTVREIISLANQADIPITDISFPASTLGAPAVKAAPSTNGSSTTPAAPTPPPVTQVKPVDGIKGVYKMEIIIVSSTVDPKPYSNVQNFLTLLEKNRRTAQVSQLIITPNSIDINKLSFTLTLNVFIKP